MPLRVDECPAGLKSTRLQLYRSFRSVLLLGVLLKLNLFKMFAYSAVI